MNRRLIVFGLVAAGLTGGLVAPALADSGDTRRHKICVDNARYLPDGYCIVWDDPIGEQP